jgi:hypothetical protein
MRIFNSVTESDEVYKKIRVNSQDSNDVSKLISLEEMTRIDFILIQFIYLIANKTRDTYYGTKTKLFDSEVCIKMDRALAT